jgi:hypothetical protein
MVFDHYSDRIPREWPVDQTSFNILPAVPLDMATQLENLRKLIDEFREAVAAARKIDTLTGQPDCEDPEKAKLEARVAELESKLVALEKGRDKALRSKARPRKPKDAAR